MSAYRKKFLRAVWLIPVALQISGCQGMIAWVDDLFAPVGGWVKPGVSREERRRDQDECEKAAIAAEGRGPNTRLNYERCMREKGYELGST